VFTKIMLAAFTLLAFFKTEATATSWFLKKNATGIEATSHQFPHHFRLEQNYPNPFSRLGRGAFGNPSTTIRFSLPQRERVTLKVFDANGREVASLVDGEMEAGNHAVPLVPAAMPSGLYFYTITASQFTQTRKAILLK